MNKSKFFLSLILIAILVFPIREVYAEGAEGLIIVRGEASVKLRPNIGYLSLSVLTEGKTEAETLEANNKRVEKLIGSLRAWGIKEEDIVTDYFNIEPIYDYSKKEREFKGYGVNNSLTITFRQLEDAGELIGLSIKSGANRVSSLSFGSTESDTAYLEALDLAYKNGRKKAEALGKIAGLKLDKPSKIVESSSNFYSRSISLDSVKEMSDVAVPIEIEDLNISGNLELEFRY